VPTLYLLRSAKQNIIKTCNRQQQKDSCKYKKKTSKDTILQEIKNQSSRVDCMEKKFQGPKQLLATQFFNFQKKLIYAQKYS
jgi:hypothetical protein